LLTLELQSGDLLLFTTDGITEPRNAEGPMYEELGRFHEVLSELSDELNAEEVVESIIQDVIAIWWMRKNGMIILRWRWSR